MPMDDSRTAALVGRLWQVLEPAERKELIAMVRRRDHIGFEQFLERTLPRLADGDDRAWHTREPGREEPEELACFAPDPFMAVLVGIPAGLAWVLSSPWRLVVALLVVVAGAVTLWQLVR
jgi:hypothetical protein